MQINITQEIKTKANNIAKEMGILKRSILDGKGNLAGIIGELIVKDFISGSSEDSYDFDLSKDGITYDIKTKQVSTAPKKHYECSIAEYQKGQDCDRYIFVRVDLSKNVAWILGWIDKKEFFERASFVKKGDKDESNGWIAKVNCFNLKIEDLNDIKNLI